MNSNQKKTGEGLATLPVKEHSSLTSHAVSVANATDTGFDVLQATQQTAACGQYPSGGVVPNAAPADAVQPAVGEVQL